jgi:hypothetical protein
MHTEVIFKTLSVIEFCKLVVDRQIHISCIVFHDDRVGHPNRTVWHRDYLCLSAHQCLGQTDIPAPHPAQKSDFSVYWKLPMRGGQVHHRADC